MERAATSTPVDEFEGIYKASDDPWATGWRRALRTIRYNRLYEPRKYWRILRLMPRRKYRVALQLACSVGAFTPALSRRCEHLVALDYSPTALAHAAKRSRGRRNVSFLEAKVPEQFPAQQFDLIVYAETAYYLSPADFEATAQRIVEQLTPGGILAMVHYRHHDTYPFPGDAAHDRFVDEPALAHLKDWRTKDYRMDLFEKRSG